MFVCVFVCVCARACFSLFLAYLKLIVPLLKRYESVTFPVLTRYTSVTATSNIYYNTSLLCNNNGSSQLDLFICVNYRGSSFYELVCCFVFAAPLRALFSFNFYDSVEFWFCALCVNVLFFFF